MDKSFLIVLLAFVLASCQSYKKVPYLQDAEVVLYGVRMNSCMMQRSCLKIC